MPRRGKNKPYSRPDNFSKRSRKFSGDGENFNEKEFLNRINGCVDSNFEPWPDTQFSRKISNDWLNDWDLHELFWKCPQMFDGDDSDSDSDIIEMSPKKPHKSSIAKLDKGIEISKNQKLWVDNIGKIDKRELERYFSKFGKVLSIERSWEAPHGYVIYEDPSVVEYILSIQNSEGLKMDVQTVFSLKKPKFVNRNITVSLNSYCGCYFCSGKPRPKDAIDVNTIENEKELDFKNKIGSVIEIKPIANRVCFHGSNKIDKNVLHSYFEQFGKVPQCSKKNANQGHGYREII